MGVDEPVSPSVLVVAAGFTIDLHRTKNCSKCAADGCSQLKWAQEEIANYRRDRDADLRRRRESVGEGAL